MGGLIIVFLGVIIVFWGIVILFKNNKTLKWKETVGEITDLELLVDSSITDPTLTCKVKYSYMVLGTSFIGDKIKISQKSINTGEDNEVYEVLKDAKKVRIYYNPSKPNESCIIKGSTFANFALILFGVTILLFGAFMTYIGDEEENDENINTKEIIFVEKNN